MVFLIWFQAYWLRQAAYDEHRRLKRELNVMLRETVMKEQFKYFDWNGKNGGNPFGRPNTDTAGNTNTVRIQNIQNAPAKETIVVKGLPITDSNRGRDRARFSFGEFENRSNSDIKITEMAVSVMRPFRKTPPDSLRKPYQKLLNEANINLTFKLRDKPVDSTEMSGRMEIRLPDSSKNNSADVTKVERLMPDRIEAVFSNPIWVIGKKLQWQILMAFLMTMAISAAFIFLYRNLRQMQRLADLKNNFISNITHELKTPIATVSVAIEALKNFNASHDAQRTEEYLNISANELQRLSLLVDKVLKLSMFEQDKLELKSNAINLKKLVDDVLDSLKLQFEKNEANVVFETIGQGFMMQGDAMHLQSVVYNLLDNAQKYANGKPVIEVSLLQKEAAIILKITDKGLGIPAEYHHKLFEKFFRVPHGNQHNIKGYGLGLSYVAEVVKRHHGTIQVQSEPDKGSSFTITFPIT